MALLHVHPIQTHKWFSQVHCIYRICIFPRSCPLYSQMSLLKNVCTDKTHLLQNCRTCCMENMLHQLMVHVAEIVSPFFSSTAEPSIKSAGGLCHTFCEGCFTDLLEIFGFSRMCSKGSRFNPGVWALRCVCSTLCVHVRNRSHPFATVRNRSCEDRMAVPMVSSAGGDIFGGFLSLLRFARQAWHFVTFRRVL